MKRITVAIAGCGARGKDTYAKFQQLHPDLMQIVAIADIDPAKRAEMQQVYGLTPEQCYDSAEAMLAQPRLADAMFICTPDRLHYEQAMAALELDYHLLLEKPIAPTVAECKAIEELAIARKRHVVVCHVLRYTVFYQKIKELLNSGVIGETISIDAIERVGYWHQAHSFVRGNWRSAELSTPMILQKCCHDMDMLLWLSGKHCQGVSSFGSLRHFTSANAPEGAPSHCIMGCPVANTCPYNAEAFYLDLLHRDRKGWPLNVVHINPTEENIREQLRSGPYGRCVYHCDNDVVDHQVVNLSLDDEVTVSFTMCAFTNANTRHMRLMGTHGEIYADMEHNTIDVMPFRQEPTHIDVSKLSDDFSGHAGGDMRMVEDFLALVAGEAVGSTALSSISHSVESHVVALAAEQSRLSDGAIVKL